MRRAPATAKINLALVVGNRGESGLHEVATVYQRIALCDRVCVVRSRRLEIVGFGEDTLVRDALAALADAAGVRPEWRARIEKRIPVAAGLGGGSSDAATALRLANSTLDRPLGPAALHALASRLGADVPFFLAAGPQLGEGDGTELTPLELPQDYWIVLVLPDGARKVSTSEVYAAFDARAGATGCDARRADLLLTLAKVRRPRDLALLPPNDLASSPLTRELYARGAFRADVSGAGPAVYGLFQKRAEAAAAGRTLRPLGRTWVSVPAWYF